VIRLNLAKQRTYPQNQLSKRLKVNFGPFSPVFGPSGQKSRFIEVDALMDGAQLLAGSVSVYYF